MRINILYKEEDLVLEKLSSHKNFKDITGCIFSRLTVLGFSGRNKHGNIFWFCRCDCGNITKISGSNLRNGTSSSCGCFRSEKVKERLIIHGKYKKSNISPEHNTWQSMLNRCLSPKNKQFHRYGGRGIQVCDRWKESFENFLADMGKRPEGKTLDRYPDNNGNYCPENCRWATRKEQQNNMSSNKELTFDGRIQNISQWANEAGIKVDVFWHRINYGWPIEKAMSTPVRKMNKRKI